MILYYVRHGDPIYNPDMLTPLGHEQARAVAKRLSLFGIDRIFASSSNRARQTAEPTCELLKKEMTVCDWANEGYVWQEFTVETANGNRTWGFQDKETIELFNSKEIWELGNVWYTHGALHEGFKNGMERVNREVDEFFLSLGYRHDRENGRFEAVNPNNERIALFAHQGFGLHWLAHLTKTPYHVFTATFDI